MHAERRRRERRRNLVFGAAIAVTAVAIISAVAVTLALRASASGIAGLRTFSGLARTHVTGKVSYRQHPPAGEPHDAVWLNCGIYPRPVPNGMPCTASSMAPCGSPTALTCPPRTSADCAAWYAGNRRAAAIR
jgi:hypothetical protein